MEYFGLRGNIYLMINDSVVEVRNLVKKFGDSPAISGISIDIPRGIVGLVGPNGAGKTTLLNILAGFIKPTYGYVRIWGYDPWRDNFRIKKHISYLTEDIYFPPSLRAYEFLVSTAEIYGIDDPEGYVISLLERLDFTWALNTKIGAYSQGMYKRLGVIYSLLNPEAKFIMLDEPFSNVDVESANLILKVIEEEHRRRGGTILVSSHILTYLDRICDKYLLINQGRLAVNGLVNNIWDIVDTIIYRIRSTDNDKLIQYIRKELNAQPVKVGGEIRVEVDKNTNFIEEVVEAAKKLGIKIYELKISEETYVNIFTN